MHPAPPLNALRAFEAAARHLSLTKAAQELNVTPGAISHQIRGLETLLGVELFGLHARVEQLARRGERNRPGAPIRRPAHRPPDHSGRARATLGPSVLPRPRQWPP